MTGVVPESASSNLATGNVTQLQGRRVVPACKGGSTPPRFLSLYLGGLVDLFRCHPFYLQVLQERASGVVRHALLALEIGKRLDDPAMEVAAVERLFEELVLRGGLA